MTGRAPRPSKRCRQLCGSVQFFFKRGLCEPKAFGVAREMEETLIRKQGYGGFEPPKEAISHFLDVDELQSSYCYEFGVPETNTQTEIDRNSNYPNFAINSKNHINNTEMNSR